MASAHQIFGEMESAETPEALAQVLTLRAGDVVALGAIGYTVDVAQLREAAIRHAERVTGEPFTSIISDAMQLCSE